MIVDRLPASYLLAQASAALWSDSPSWAVICQALVIPPAPGPPSHRMRDEMCTTLAAVTMMQATYSYNDIRAGTPRRNLDAVAARSERRARSLGI